MQAPVSGKPQLNRRINASLVFGVIQREGPISRADLAKRTGIRSTSISAIVQQLLDEHLVHEVGRGESTGGRHPILLEVNAAGLYAAGMEVAEDEINGVVVDLVGKLHATENIPLPDTSVETVVAQGSQLLDKLAVSSGISRDVFSAVGVAVPGIITQRRGSVILSKPLDWQNVPLRDILEEKWNTDVYVLNNAMAGAMAEYFGGLGKDVLSLLYVLVYVKHVRHTALTSLGCGIVLDGRAYLGEGQIAGEVRVDIDHPLAAASKLFGDSAPVSMDDLVSASRAEPEKYASVWNSFAQDMGSVIARGMDFLSPGRVVIGTDMPEISEFVSDTMRDVLRSKSMSGLLEELPAHDEKSAVRLLFAPLQKDTLARGAIVPRLQELSLVPLLRESVLS